ncbi:MAG: DUF202 domain-containing protein [Bacteroidota bacterium]
MKEKSTVDHPNMTNGEKLALDRTRLANERTLLAFIRTGLYFLVMGLTVIKLEFFAPMSWYSMPLFALSLVFWGLGLISYMRTNRKIKGYFY